MPALSPSVPPHVTRETDTHTADLVHDLSALTLNRDLPDADLVQGRTGVLRALAAHLAADVPRPTDRLAARPQLARLLSAIALHLGLPMVTVDPRTEVLGGELFAGERVAVLGWAGTDEVVAAVVTRAHAKVIHHAVALDAHQHAGIPSVSVPSRPPTLGGNVGADAVHSGHAGSDALAATTSALVGRAELAVNETRLVHHLMKFAELTESDRPGVTRLGYSAVERAAHKVFAEHMTALGLNVHTDAAGNTIAELAGRTDLPAIGTGSHLDSVPSAGRFDGIVGVAAAMEIATVVTSARITPRHRLRFVAFAAEEGARFGQACLGSRMAAGLTDATDLHDMVDANGVSAYKAMRSVNLRPDNLAQARWDPEKWLAFVELHIEQGSVLSDSGMAVGVVDAISGSTRLTLELTGRATHSGGTPMDRRADALAAAAEIVLVAENLAVDDRHRGTRITVGRLKVEPGSITTIPGLCVLTVDVRDTDANRQRESADTILAHAHRIGARRGVGVEANLIGDVSPVVLPTDVRAITTAAAQRLRLPFRVLASGASHDAQMINHIVPSGMIFVPSRNDGVSHAPDELSLPADIAIGTSLLLTTLLDLDTAHRRLSPARSTGKQ